MGAAGRSARASSTSARALERGGVRRPGVPARAGGDDRSLLTALVQHLLGLLALAGIVVGPLPLCLGLVPLESRSPARALLAVLVTWCLLQVCVGLVLGVTGWLWLGGVLLCETVAFFAGLAMPSGRRGLAVLRASRPHLVWPEHLLVFAFAVLGPRVFHRLAH